MPAWLCILALLLTSALEVFADTWKKLDEHRYETEVVGWKLLVDAKRGRLISAIPPAGENIFLRDAHRVWLGPQNEWPSQWPPPKEWEDGSESHALSTDASELTIVTSKIDPNYPQLTRRYRITENGLLLIAAWQPLAGQKPWQCIHILQTRTDAVLHVAFKPTLEAPLGYGLLSLHPRPGNNFAGPIPKDIATAVPGKEEDRLYRLAYGGREEKIGVAPQTIETRFPQGYGFRLWPAEHNGKAQDGIAPDGGLLTQGYFGAPSFELVESEQLTPRLTSTREDGWVEVSVKLVLLNAD